MKARGGSLAISSFLAKERHGQFFAKSASLEGPGVTAGMLRVPYFSAAEWRRIERVLPPSTRRLIADRQVILVLFVAD